MCPIKSQARNAESSERHTTTSLPIVTRLRIRTKEPWWMAAVTDIAPLAQKWKDYPLMQNLLLAIYDYMDFKAKEKTKELNEFV